MKLTPEEICALCGCGKEDMPCPCDFTCEDYDITVKAQEALLSKLQNTKLDDLREEITELNLRYLTLCKRRDDYSPALVESELTGQILCLITSLVAVQIEAAEARGYERRESEVAGTTIVLPHRLLHEDKLIGGTA